MKTRECVYCETFFDFKGKPNRNPCVNFEDRRKKENGFDEILHKEMGKLNDKNKQ